MCPIVLQQLLVHIELHAQDKVGVLDGGVGDEEGHCSQRGQPVHLPNGYEHQSKARNQQQGVHWNLVGPFLL